MERFFPRCYHMNNPTDKHAFLTDFKLTRAEAILKLQLLAWACGYVHPNEPGTLSLAMLERRVRERVEKATVTEGETETQETTETQDMRCPSGELFGWGEAGNDSGDSKDQREKRRQRSYCILMKKALLPTAVKAAAAALRRHLAMMGRQITLIDCPFISDEEWNLIQSVRV